MSKSLKELLELFECGSSSCNCGCDIQETAPETSYSLSVYYTLTDGTSVSKSFDDVEEFILETDKIRNLPYLKSYSFSSSEVWNANNSIA